MTDSADVPSSSLIRQSEILRHQVLDQQTLDPFGRVEGLWMYPQVNRVLGIICRPGLLGSRRFVFKLPQIIGVPEHSAKAQILVHGEPEETVVDKVQQLESLIDTPVYSEAGESIGRITDCLFDLKNGVIIRYLVVPDAQLPRLVAGFTEGIYLLSPKQIKSFSRQRVLINAERVDDLRLYDEGLRLKLAQMSAMLKQDYWDGATEEWQSLARHVQLIMAQARTTLITFAEKAKVKVQDLSQNFSQTVSDQEDNAADLGDDGVDSGDDEAPWDDWLDDDEPEPSSKHPNRSRPSSQSASSQSASSQSASGQVEHSDRLTHQVRESRSHASMVAQRPERGMSQAPGTTRSVSSAAVPDADSVTGGSQAASESDSKSDSKSDADFDVDDPCDDPWID